ncbi:MAG: metal ABC transporter substrate-binding protein [Limisphaerales bacterium]
MARTVWVALWLWVGLSAGSAAPEPRRLRVLTSFLPVYCFTVNVTGRLAEVENFLPAGVEPHEYQLAPRDLQRLGTADLIVVNGLQLESWLNHAIQIGAIRDPARVVRAAAGLEAELIFTGSQPMSLGTTTASGQSAAPAADAPRGVPNPHIWLDPRLAAQAVSNVLAALQKADPTHAAAYAGNASAYLQRLKKLDAEIRRATAPLQQRAFITCHNAFPYFSRRYGLKILGVIEQTPDVNPSPRYLAHLSQVVRQQHVKAIFTERRLSTTLAEQLGRDLDVPVAELDTLETGQFVPTAYEDGMRADVATLVQYLR